MRMEIVVVLGNGNAMRKHYEVKDFTYIGFEVDNYHLKVNRI